jgi:hypothetical protein
MATSGSARKTVIVEASGEPRSYELGGQAVTHVPLTIRRRGVQKVLTPPPGHASATEPVVHHTTMIRLLGKAFYWQRLLDEGRFSSGNELARHLHVDEGWVAQVLRLTLLAPDIVEAILEGSQPRHLYPHLIKGRAEPLPRLWDQQRELLGFTPLHA